MTALSKAEKAAVRSEAFLLILTFLIDALTESSRFLLRAVLILSFLTFFIADFIIGIFFIHANFKLCLERHKCLSYVNIGPSLVQAYLVQFLKWLKICYPFFIQDRHQFYLEQ